MAERRRRKTKPLSHEVVHAGLSAAMTGLKVMNTGLRVVGLATTLLGALASPLFGGGGGSGSVGEWLKSGGSGDSDLDGWDGEGYIGGSFEDDDIEDSYEDSDAGLTCYRAPAIFGSAKIEAIFARGDVAKW